MAELEGNEKRERLALMTLRSQAGRVMNVFAPSLVDPIAARAIARRR